MRFRSVAGAVALFFAALPVAAQERHVSEPCRAAMAVAWPRLLGARDADSRRQIIAELPALKAVCAKDREALLDIALLRAGFAMDAQDATTVFAELDAAGFTPADPHYAQSRWFYLAAAEGIQDAPRFRAARDALLAAHDAAFVKQPGVRKREHFTTPIAQVDAYETSDPARPFVFVAASDYGGLPASLTAVRQDYTAPDGSTLVFYTAQGCSSGVNPFETSRQAAGAPPDYAAARAAAVKAFSAPPADKRAWLDDGLLPAFDHPRRGEYCSNADAILPGFAGRPAFTGSEYAPASATRSEKELEAMLAGSPDQSRQAADYVMAHPDSVAPADYIYVVGRLMHDGNMERAAFWYYLWQIRIWPWLERGPAAPAIPLNQMAAIVTEEMGRPINEWAGSDFDAWRGLMLRASSYERTFPLYAGKPAGLSDSEWQERVAKSRATHDQATLDSVIPDTPQAKADNEAARRKNGLYVGPWKSPGKPLPDDWR